MAVDGCLRQDGPHNPSFAGILRREWWLTDQRVFGQPPLFSKQSIPSKNPTHRKKSRPRRRIPGASTHGCVQGPRAWWVSCEGILFISTNEYIEANFIVSETFDLQRKTKLTARDSVCGETRICSEKPNSQRETRFAARNRISDQEATPDKPLLLSRQIEFSVRNEFATKRGLPQKVLRCKKSSCSRQIGSPRRPR